VLTADLSVKQLIERQAAALAPNADAASDLTLAAMQMGLGLAGQPTLNLAQPHPNQPPGRTLWLVGVRDASNAEFLFDDVALVGHNRRDQVQFLRLQTGLQLRDLADFAAMSARLDAVAPQRNPYVLDSLARDDGAARVFALALACGLIQVGGRGFVVQTGDEGITVGANPDEAVNALGQDTVLMAQLSAQVDALPLNTLAERLATFVSHAVGMGEEDGGLWPELAEHVQARLKLVQSQLRYAAIAPASATPTDTVSMNGHMDQR